MGHPSCLFEHGPGLNFVLTCDQPSDAVVVSASRIPAQEAASYQQHSVDLL